MIKDVVEKTWLDRNIYVHHTAVIYPGVEIENGVEIGPHCIIGKRPEILRGIDTHEVGRVIIRKGAKLEGLVTVDSGSDGVTEIGAGCFLMKQTHVGHDAVLGERVILSPGARVGGECSLEDDVYIGMNAVIHQQTAIPKRVCIGMGAVVTKKAAAKMEHTETWVGNPAYKAGPNKRWL